MNTFKKILVPLDGSKLAEQALSQAAELARAFGSEVLLLQVCEPENMHHQDICRAYLEEMSRQMRELIGPGKGPPVLPAVVVGKPVERILAFTEEQQVGIIVMTTCGKSGVMPWTMGSTCHRVMQRSDIPVLALNVRTEGGPGRGRLFSRILVPLDASEMSEGIVSDVSQLIQKLGSSAVLLHVIAPGQHVHTTAGLRYVQFKDQDISTVKRRSLQYLEKVKAKMMASGRIELHVRTGDPAKEIVLCAIESDCTLIAMSSHGHSGIEAWAFGSVTTKVLQHADRSVLLHRSHHHG